MELMIIFFKPAKTGLFEHNRELQPETSKLRQNHWQVPSCQHFQTKRNHTEIRFPASLANSGPTFP